MKVESCSFSAYRRMLSTRTHINLEHLLTNFFSEHLMFRWWSPAAQPWGTGEQSIALISLTMGQKGIGKGFIMATSSEKIKWDRNIRDSKRQAHIAQKILLQVESKNVWWAVDSICNASVSGIRSGLCHEHLRIFSKVLLVTCTMDYKTGLWHFIDELRRAAKFLEG